MTRLENASFDDLIAALPREDPLLPDPSTPEGMTELIRQEVASMSQKMHIDALLETMPGERQLKKESRWGRAMMELVQRGDASVPALAAALATRDSWYVRAFSALALSHIGTEAAGAALLSALETEPSGLVERHLINGLSACRFAPAVPALTARLKLPWPWRTLPSSSPLDIASSALYRLDRTILGLGIPTVMALDRIGDPAPIPALKELRFRLKLAPAALAESGDVTFLTMAVDSSLKSLQAA